MDVVSLTIINGPTIVGTSKMCVYKVELFDDPYGKGYYLDFTKEFKYIYSILRGGIEPPHFVYDVFHPLSSTRITPHNIHAIAFDFIQDANNDYDNPELYCTFELTVFGK